MKYKKAIKIRIGDTLACGSVVKNIWTQKVRKRWIISFDVEFEGKKFRTKWMDDQTELGVKK